MGASLPLLVIIIIILSKLYVINISFIFSRIIVNMNILYSIIIFLAFLVKFPMFLFIMIFALLGGRILRIVCLINRDIKVIIAYSSVVHIALIIVNLISKNLLGLIGSILL